jgi:hypothetical protein
MSAGLKRPVLGSGTERIGEKQRIQLGVAYSLKVEGV